MLLLHWAQWAINITFSRGSGVACPPVSPLSSPPPSFAALNSLWRAVPEEPQRVLLAALAAVGLQSFSALPALICS